MAETGGILPDGSAFFTASFPLPKSHWIYQRGTDGFGAPPPMPMRLGRGHAEFREWVDRVTEAARWAIKASTRHGEDSDFDPDAMSQNFVVALFGYNTANGLSGEAWQNPSPVPPLFLPMRAGGAT